MVEADATYELTNELFKAVIDYMLELMELPALADLEEGRLSIIKAMQNAEMRCISLD